MRGKSVEELRSAYFQVHMMLKEYGRTLQEEELLRGVAMPPDSEVTLRWALWHMAEHSMLH